MADYNISGITPALIGGEWDNGSSWFLIDKSGSFSVDRDITATFFIVGCGENGEKGKISRNLNNYYTYCGDGGSGGSVYTVQSVKLKAGEICNFTIGKTNGENTEVNISGATYKSNSEGYTKASGAAGFSGLLMSGKRKEGSIGTLTPYGYVGNGGDGGKVGIDSVSSSSWKNYGCGGHGGDVPYERKSGTYSYYGHGVQGCVIVCVETVETPEIKYQIEKPTPKELVYNGLLQFPFDVSTLQNITVTGDLNAISSGKYTSTLTLADGVGWTDGTCDPIEIEWEIKKATAEKPTVSLLEYEYDGSGAYDSSCYKLPTIEGFNSNIMTQSGTGLTKQYKAGVYPITFALKDEDSCSWDDGSTDDYIVEWTIKPKVAKIPMVKSEDFSYDGKPHSATVDGVDLKIMTQSGNIGTATNVGNYSIVYTLRDPDSCSWEDGTTAPKTVHWSVIKQVVVLDKPYLKDDQKSFVYNGKAYTPIITGRDDNKMMFSGTLSSIAAGDWEITIELKTSANYEYQWSDGTTDSFVLPWRVEKGVFDVKLSFYEIDYDGQKITNYVTGYDSVVMIQTGILSAAKAGEYSVTYILKDKYSAVWADGSVDDKTLTWKINPITLAVPTVSYNSFEVDLVYNGGSTSVGQQTLPMDGFDSYMMSVKGNTGNYPNNYTAVVTLKDTDSCTWEDGTVEGKSFDWEITKKELVCDKPTISPTEFTYTGLTQTTSFQNYQNTYYGHNIMEYSGDLSGVTARIYPVVVSFCNSNLYDLKWNDGSNDPVELEWSINKTKFAIPEFTVGALKYDGTTKRPTESGYDANVMERTSDSVLSAVSVGVYSITYSLKDINSTSWDDGTIKDKTVKWIITEGDFMEIPTVSSLEFTYDGTAHAPTVEGFNSDIMVRRGTWSAVNAGEYSLIIALKDPDSCAWADGTIKEKVYKWNITKKVVQYPKPYIRGANYYYGSKTYTVYGSEFDYTGNTHTIFLGNYSSSAMSVTGISAVRAGEYTAVVSLKNNTNYAYQWSDGTIDDLKLEWKINKISLSIPTLSQTLFFYGGSPKYNKSNNKTYYSFRYPRISGFNKRYMIQTGITEGYKKSEDGIFKYTEDVWYGASQWRIGKYYVTFSLRDPKSVTWADGTVDKITYEWSIQREVILLPKPYIENTVFEYDGTVKAPLIRNGNNAGLIWEGTKSAVAVGDYAISVTLYRYSSDEDTIDYRWEDNTIEPGEFNWDWRITKASIKIPSISSTKFVFDGTEHSPVINDFDANTMIVTGDTKRVLAGEYEILFSLKDTESATWSDGTVEDKIFTWTIEKAVILKPTISPDYMEYDGEAHTVEFIENQSEHSFIVSGFVPEIMLSSGDIRKTDVGNYSIIVKLKYKNSCTWFDGTVDDVALLWEIRKKTVLLDKPYLEPAEFMYDGTTHTPTIERYKTPGMVIKEGSATSAVAAGDYTITLALLEDKNITYLWGDTEVNAIDGELVLNWKIKKADGSSGDGSSGDRNGIKIPDVTELEFVYDGRTHAPVITSLNANVVAVSGVQNAVNAGEYEIIFSLKDKDSAEWEDGTKDDIIIKWTIKKQSIGNKSELSLNPEKFVFDGELHSPSVKNFNATQMILSGDISGTKAGEYVVIVSLNGNYQWADGTTGNVRLGWNITKRIMKETSLFPDNFIFNGLEQAPEIIGAENDFVDISGVKSATAAGNYSIILSLKNKVDCSWFDGTADDITLDWKIEKGVFEKPVISSDSFVYNGLMQSPKMTYNENIAFFEGDIGAVTAGNYKITFSLKDKNSSSWSDGSIDDISLDWVINKAVLRKPEVINLDFLYDGNEHAPDITEFDRNIIKVSGVTSAINAGNYKITFLVKDKDSADWIDRSAEDFEVEWFIRKVAIEKPTIQNTEFDYNWGTHKPLVRGFDDKLMLDNDSKTVRSAVDAGHYHIYIALKDTRNYVWADNGSETVDLEWVIHGRPVDKPYLDENSFQYTGKTQTPTIIGFKSVSMDKSGDLSGVKIGEYTAVIKLKKNYEWSDGGVDDLELPWKITKIFALVPTVTNTEFLFDGASHSPTIGGYDVNVITRSGTTIASNAGNYKITFSLKDKQYCEWVTGGSENISVEWKISKIVLDKPVGIDLDFVYNGGYNSPVIEGINSRYMTVTHYDGDKGVYVLGVGKQINAGNYSCTVQLNDTKNYAWADGTSGNIVFKWVVTRKTVAMPYLEPNLFEYNGTSKTPVIKGFNRDIMEIVYGNGDPRISYTSAVNVGKYKIVILLGVKKYKNGVEYYQRNFQWADGTVNNLVLEWEIVPGYLDYPTLIENSLVYNWQTQTPKISGFLSGQMACVGTWRAVDVGVYQIGFKLKEGSNFKWRNPEDEGKLFTWEITRKVIKKIPYKKNDLVYNGQKQSPVWLDYDIRQLDIGGVNEAVNAGEYIAEFTPTKNFMWADGSTGVLRLSWVIAKLVIGIPTQANILYYNGKEQKPAWRDIDAAKIIYSGETSGINAREYYVSCECNENCFFGATGTRFCDTSWVIQKKKLQAPEAERNYPYTGEEIFAVFKNYYSDLMTVSGDLSGVNVGDYAAYFDIKDKNNYTWAENVYTDKNGYAGVSWKIVSSRKVMKVPYQRNYLVYSGEKQSPVFANFDSSVMMIIGGSPSEVYAGVYYVTFRLIGNAVWNDGTTEDKVVTWEIDKKALPCPFISVSIAEGGMYYYEIEGRRYPVWKNFSSDDMTMSGDTYDNDGEWHITSFELKDPDNFAWGCVEGGIFTINWKLSTAYTPEVKPGSGAVRVHVPRQIRIPFEDGSTKYPEWDSFNNIAIMKIGGVWEGISADTYYVILELRKGYVWEDGTAEIKAIPWKILEIGEKDSGEVKLLEIHIPKQINIPYYDGYVKEPEWDIWDKFGFDIVKGELYGVLAGVYLLVLRLQTGYIWEDGTLEDKTVLWVIEPRDVSDVVDIPDDETPRAPDPEKEGNEISDGDIEEQRGSCCCCCNTGLFEMLKNSCDEKTDE